MIVSIFLSLSHCALGIFATRNHVNHRDEYGLELPKNLQSLHFHGTAKAIKLAKKVKVKLSKVKFINISCKKCLILDVAAIERSVQGGNVSWDLKMMSTIERCPL